MSTTFGVGSLIYSCLHFWKPWLEVRVNLVCERASLPDATRLQSFDNPKGGALTNVVDRAFKARPSVKALRAALLTLENTLLIASYAMYGAVIYQLDHLNVHHFVLVCWLSVVSLSTAVALPRSHRYAITTSFAPYRARRPASETRLPWRLRFALGLRGVAVLPLVLLSW
jgi:hypothetical protein